MRGINPSVAPFAAGPVKVDGVLDEPIWQTAPSYELAMSVNDVTKEGRRYLEGGRFQVAWDDKFVYLAIRFGDGDVVAEGDKDEQMHFALGDTVEWFLKPQDKTWYWELYGTPTNKKTTLMWAGRGRIGLASYQAISKSGLTVAAKAEGTGNDWSDIDKGWSAELAMPVADLTARGEKVGPGAVWRILVSRYNYGVTTDWKELSAFPTLSKTNFHFIEEYGWLEFTK